MERAKQPAWSCDGKHGYPDYRQADKATRALLRYHADARGTNMRPYRCKACRLWHVGSGMGPND